MAIDGIFIHHLLQEIKPNLINARIEKIATMKSLFLFSLYSLGTKKSLYLDLTASNCSIYFNQHQTLDEQTTFLSIIKKHLEGGAIKDIQQIKSDRILVFDIQVNDYILGIINKQLVFELMGKHANLILLQDNKVIDCYKRSFNIDGRHLVPSANFEHFHSEKLDASLYTFNSLDTARDIQNKYLGISLDLAKFLVQNPINPLEIKVNPTLETNSNKIYFANIFDTDVKAFDTLSSLLSTRSQTRPNIKRPYQSFINNLIKRADQKLLTLKAQKLQNLDFEKYAQAGNMIYAAGLDLSQKISTLNDLELNPLKTLNENAQDYFKIYHKLKRSIKHLDEQITKQESLLLSFHNYLEELELTDEKDIKQFDSILSAYGLKTTNNKKKSTKPKILNFSDEHATYYVGKNAIQNQYLVHELAKPNNTWFHVKDHSGSHIIVQTQALNDQVIRKAAMLAAYFSKYRFSSSIPVLYTQVKYVSKISGFSGSFVKYKHEKTIFIDIDQDLINKWLNNE